MQESIKRIEEKDKSVKNYIFCSCDGRNAAATTVSHHEACYDRNTLATTVTRGKTKAARNASVKNVMCIPVMLKCAERGKAKQKEFSNSLFLSSQTPRPPLLPQLLTFLHLWRFLRKASLQVFKPTAKFIPL